MEADDLYQTINALPAASGVYRIWNERTGDSYIGASKNIRVRCFQHFSRMSNGQASKVLAEAFRPGNGSACIEVLTLCDPGELDREERRFIRQLKPSLNSHPHKRLKSAIDTKKEMVTIAEAAKLKNCSRQAIHAAIRSNRLEGVPETVTTTIWHVTSKSLAQFKPNPNMQRSGRPRKDTRK
jgi:hypothetical protein